MSTLAGIVTGWRVFGIALGLAVTAYGLVLLFYGLFEANHPSARGFIINAAVLAVGFALLWVSARARPRSRQ